MVDLTLDEVIFISIIMCKQFIAQPHCVRSRAIIQYNNKNGL